jgi:hypothetical protein
MVLIVAGGAMTREGTRACRAPIAQDMQFLTSFR